PASKGAVCSSQGKCSGTGRAQSPLAMAAPGGLGRCVVAFWLALAFDGLGLAVLLTGVFADLFFSDLLIYGGGIAIFLSLIWWVFWYAGNLEVPPAELRDDVGLEPPKGRGDSLLRGLVRGLSSRISTAFSSAPRSRSPPRPARLSAASPGGAKHGCEAKVGEKRRDGPPAVEGGSVPAPLPAPGRA
uniref:Transmembrane protein 238 n=1 Tax=Pelusios castaneus TaxID=367368 RepID=A0A8C8SV91_9SAUR